MNNAFQISARTNLAILYNDGSVLENRHASHAFMRMLGVEGAGESRHDELNILKNVSTKQFASIRTKVVQAILGTDMSEHFRTVNMVKAMIMDFQQGGELEKDDTWKILQYLLHVADISNQGKNGPLFEKWTERCLTEFFLQGDKEAEMGLPISQLCDRKTTKLAESQVGFIVYVVLPAYETLGMIIPEVGENVVPVIKKNLCYWEGRKGERKEQSV